MIVHSVILGCNSEFKKCLWVFKPASRPRGHRMVALTTGTTGNKLVRNVRFITHRLQNLKVKKGGAGGSLPADTIPTNDAVNG